MMYSVNLHYALKVSEISTFGENASQRSRRHHHYLHQPNEDLNGDCGYRNMMAALLWEHLHDRKVDREDQFSGTIKLALEWLDVPEDRFRSFGREHQKKLVSRRANFNQASRNGRPLIELLFNEPMEGESERGTESID